VGKINSFRIIGQHKNKIFYPLKFSNMVRIRLQRFGKKGEPIYRIVVADSRWKRDGKVIEILGYYNPKRDWDFKLDLQKYNDWIKKGAQPTPRVKSIFKLQMKKEVQK